VIYRRDGTRTGSRPDDTNWTKAEIKSCCRHGDMEGSPPPGYRPQEKREPLVVGPPLAWIHEMLEQNKKEPRKQRHMAKRFSTG